MVAATIILDLDGTVWDSRPWYAETIARLSNCSASKVKRELDAGASVVKTANDHGVRKAQLIGAAGKDSPSVRLYEGVLPTLKRAPGKRNTDRHRDKSARLARQASAEVNWHRRVRRRR